MNDSDRLYDLCKEMINNGANINDPISILKNMAMAQAVATLALVDAINEMRRGLVNGNSKTKS
jgi:hypothetical protein